MKSISKITISILTIAWMVGCGPNPVNRSSDPFKNEGGSKYKAIQNDIPVELVGEKKPPLPPDQDDGNPEYCPKAYELKALAKDGKDAGKALQFKAGESKTYTFKLVQNRDQTKMGLELIGAPQGMTLRKKSNDTWEVTFRPTVEQSNLSKEIVVLVTNLPSQDCVTGEQGEHFTVSVNTDRLQPLVKVTGFNSSQLHKSTDKIPFTVDITDPSLAASEKVSKPEFDYSYGFHTGEMVYVNAKGAISCDNGSSTGPQSARFSCVFDASQLPQPKGIELAHSSFQVFARSVRGQISVKQPVLVNLSFIKPVTTAETTASAPKADLSEIDKLLKPASAEKPKTQPKKVKASSKRSRNAR